MRQLIAVALFCAGLFCIAQAQVPMTGAGLGAPAVLASYQGPSDVLGATAVHFVGLRAVSAAAASSNIQLVNLGRSSDSHTCDVLANASTGKMGNTANCSTGGDNGTLWSTWCAASGGNCAPANSNTIGVLALYDQGTAALNYTLGNTGGGITLNAIGGSNPTVSCNTSGGNWYKNITGFTQNQRFFYTMVSERTANFTTLQRGVFAANGASFAIGYDSSINNLYISGVNTVAASDSAFHSVGIDFNGSSTQVWVDGNSPSTITTSGGVTTGTISICANTFSQNFDGNWNEIGIWSGNLSANAVALSANQHGSANGWNF